MKTYMLALSALTLLGALAMPARAQEGPGGPPPPPPGGQEGGPRGHMGPGGPGGPEGMGPMRGERGPRRDGREGGMPGMEGMRGGMEGMPPQVERMIGYLHLVEQYRHLAQDPTATGVAAVVTAADILRPRGADTAIAYFEKLLPSVKNPAVQNAIRLQLIDLYRTSGQQDKALDQLSGLMKSEAPAGEPAKEGPPPGR